MNCVSSFDSGFRLWELANTSWYQVNGPVSTCAPNRCPMGSAMMESWMVMLLAPTASISSHWPNSTEMWSKIMSLAAERLRLDLPVSESSVPWRNLTYCTMSLLELAKETSRPIRPMPCPGAVLPSMVMLLLTLTAEDRL